MKKLIISLVLSLSVSANAGLLDFFDFSKFFEAAITIGEGINDNLEKIRLLQKQQLDLQEQVDIVCDVTKSLNKPVGALSELLTKYQVNQNFCAPITTVLNLQTQIIEKCRDYYANPVPESAEYLVSKFTVSIIQTRLILNKCYPILSKIKLPGLPASPGSN
jgi:hypothetical protein